MAYTGTPEDIKKIITKKISKSRYSDVTVTGTQVIQITFRTKQRFSLHDSIQELLNNSPELQSHYNLIHNPSIQTNLRIFSIFHDKKIRGKNQETRILVKPQSGREWMKEGFWNDALQSLSNWSDLKYTPDNQTEYEIVKSFNEQIAEIGNGKSVNLVIGSEEYQSIIGIVSGPPGHKADFMGVDEDGDLKFFISHKDGFNATDFQQYSGISSRSGDSIYDHPEVQRFRKTISEKSTEDFYGKMYYRPIENIDLKRRAVFGKYYDDGPSNLNSNNISHFAQGNLSLTVMNSGTKRRKPKLRLDFTTMLITRDDIDMLSNEYVPYLGARQGEAYRTLEYETDDGGSKVTGVRGGVFAKGYIESRTNELIEYN